MGMYTGIRFKGFVKPEFREGFEIVGIRGEWEEHSDPVIRAFGDIGRSGFIPRGSLDYMPDEWEDEKEQPTDGFETSYNEKTGYWAFQCSLKNYEGEIQKFFEIYLTLSRELNTLNIFMKNGISALNTI